MAVSDEWDEVKADLEERAQHGAWRVGALAMLRLIEKIKLDTRLRDLEPSVSLACLVFRRRAKRSVWVGWSEDNAYCVDLMGPGLESLETTIASDDSVIDVLREYLEKVPLP